MADTTIPINTATTNPNPTPKKQLFGGNQEVFANLEKFEQITNPTELLDSDYNFMDEEDASENQTLKEPSINNESSESNYHFDTIDPVLEETTSPTNQHDIMDLDFLDTDPENNTYSDTKYEEESDQSFGSPEWTIIQEPTNVFSAAIAEEVPISEHQEDITNEENLLPSKEINNEQPLAPIFDEVPTFEEEKQTTQDWEEIWEEVTSFTENFSGSPVIDKEEIQDEVQEIEEDFSIAEKPLIDEEEETIEEPIEEVDEEVNTDKENDKDFSKNDENILEQSDWKEEQNNNENIEEKEEIGEIPTDIAIEPLNQDDILAHQAMEADTSPQISKFVQKYHNLLEIANQILELESKLEKEKKSDFELIGNNTEKSMIRYIITQAETTHTPILEIKRIEKDYAKNSESEHILHFYTKEKNYNLMVMIDEFPLYEEHTDLLDPIKAMNVNDKLNKFELLFSEKLKPLQTQRASQKEAEEKEKAFRSIFRNF